MSSKLERISHYSIIFIAVSALFISIWQGYVSQKHNRLTVRPYFNFTTSSDSTDSTFHISLSNQGYGPAIIKEFNLYLDGQQKSSWNEIFQLIESNSGTTQTRTFEAKDVFAPGKEISILRIDHYIRGERIKLIIKYESIYKEEDEITLIF